MPTPNQPTEQPLTPRQQRAADYFLENTRLTGDLTDDQATPLIAWVSAEAARYAGDPTRSDDDVEQGIILLRRVVRRVAKQATAASSGPYLAALARQEWHRARAGEGKQTADDTQQTGQTEQKKPEETEKAEEAD